MAFDQAHMASFESFLEPRQEEDMDLVGIVRDILLKYGLKDRLEQHYDTDSYVLQAQQKRPEIQRYLLNIYLHLQLANAKKSSLEYKYALLPGGELNDWIAIIREKVAPFMATENLPTYLV